MSLFVDFRIVKPRLGALLFSKTRELMLHTRERSRAPVDKAVELYQVIAPPMPQGLFDGDAMIVLPSQDIPLDMKRALMMAQNFSQGFLGEMATSFYDDFISLCDYVGFATMVGFSPRPNIVRKDAGFPLTGASENVIMSGREMFGQNLFDKMIDRAVFVSILFPDDVAQGPLTIAAALAQQVGALRFVRDANQYEPLLDGIDFEKRSKFYAYWYKYAFLSFFMLALSENNPESLNNPSQDIMDATADYEATFKRMMECFTALSYDEKGSFGFICPLNNGKMVLKGLLAVRLMAEMKALNLLSQT